MSKRHFTESYIPEGIVARYFHTRVNNRIVKTICELVDVKEHVVVVTGCACVSPKDNPSKKIGRAISIGRALKLYHLLKAIRVK